MKDVDLERIESRLGITLPEGYRELMRTRAEELRGLTREIRGATCGWFEHTLYLDADRVIDVNLWEREPDAGTECAFPNWSTAFFLIGTNGAGDYYCLKLNGDHRVWLIGSDCGDEPTEMYGSLEQFVEEEIQAFRNEPPWQEPPILSSFDDSCPLASRFRIFIADQDCIIECQEGDRPLSEEKFRLHGVNIGEFGLCVLRAIAVLAKCDPNTMTIRVNSEPSLAGGLKLSFSEPSDGDPRFQKVGANIFDGNVFVFLHGPEVEAPPPEAVGIDWPAFQAAVSAMLSALHLPGAQVTISSPQTYDSKYPSRLWRYDFNYFLE